MLPEETGPGPFRRCGRSCWPTTGRQRPRVAECDRTGRGPHAARQRSAAPRPAGKDRDYRSSQVVIGGAIWGELVPLEEIERRYILHVLECVEGNRTQAARKLWALSENALSQAAAVRGATGWGGVRRLAFRLSRLMSGLRWHGALRISHAVPIPRPTLPASR